ncbi:Hypothetical Protein FCC1311_060302 [Hondaea fermentalgiana]|uniref:Uncharacterized protein n=1 Tax=Hondaea fermentalgiana TaxID=2315210 RepID=A0A2R5GG03_9STRA|nr:Hypothetical Protein FCC1311_060302 [Hondaea fermentalgiana]|eukprot:GBG29810.1 Hypothetical Protein FCC1311_060302 [Hondaea fermentalgiana]
MLVLLLCLAVAGASGELIHRYDVGLGSAEEVVSEGTKVHVSPFELAGLGGLLVESSDGRVSGRGHLSGISEAGAGGLEWFLGADGTAIGFDAEGGSIRCARPGAAVVDLSFCPDLPPCVSFYSGSAYFACLAASDELIVFGAGGFLGSSAQHPATAGNVARVLAGRRSLLVLFSDGGATLYLPGGEAVDLGQTVQAVLSADHFCLHRRAPAADTLQIISGATGKPIFERQVAPADAALTFVSTGSVHAAVFGDNLHPFGITRAAFGEQTGQSDLQPIGRVASALGVDNCLFVRRVDHSASLLCEPCEGSDGESVGCLPPSVAKLIQEGSFREETCACQSLLFLQRDSNQLSFLAIAGLGGGTLGDASASLERSSAIAAMHGPGRPRVVSIHCLADNALLEVRGGGFRALNASHGSSDLFSADATAEVGALSQVHALGYLFRPTGEFSLKTSGLLFHAESVDLTGSINSVAEGVSAFYSLYVGDGESVSVGEIVLAAATAILTLVVWLRETVAETAVTGAGRRTANSFNF